MKLIGNQIVVELPEEEKVYKFASDLSGREYAKEKWNECIAEVAKMNPAITIKWPEYRKCDCGAHEFNIGINACKDALSEVARMNPALEVDEKKSKIF